MFHPSRISTLILLTFASIFGGCSDDPTVPDPADTGIILTKDTHSGSDSSRKNDSGTQPDANRQDDTSDSGLPPAAPAKCSERSTTIRERAVTIIVSPAANGQVEVNGALKTLRQVVREAQSGDVIGLEDGVYTIPEAGEGSYSGLYFTTENVTLRSISGQRDAVILDSAYSNHGGQSAAITIDAPGVILADFTVKRSIFHLVHVWANADNAEIQNIVLEDGGQQFLKSSPGGDASVDDVRVTCSAFRMTDAGRDNVWGYGPQDGSTQCYTGGIDTHDAKDWYIADNYFEGIYCNAGGVQRPVHGKKSADRNNQTYTGGLSEHAIHMWDSAQGSSHLLERNKIVNCARGIGIGLVNELYGVKVINNMISSEHAGSGQHDVGIAIDRGHDILVMNNSVFFSSPQAYANAIEYRYEVSSGVVIRNNLTNKRIFSRNGANATLSNNLDDAQAVWFQDADAGDLHLSGCSIPEVIGAGVSHDDVSVDIDREAREESNDIGADQCVE